MNKISRSRWTMLLLPALVGLPNMVSACDKSDSACIDKPSLSASAFTGIAQATSVNTLANHAAVDTQRSFAPLRFVLTSNELNAIIHRYPDYAWIEQYNGMEEILVTARHEPLPMTTDKVEPWGGALAPFWALSHPTQAWRIFFPVLSP